MPRYKQARDFQVGDYWLSQRRGSPAWCRTWFEPTTRQTKRVSLGTADFDEAKERLTDWFVEQKTKAVAPPPGAEPCLAEVLMRYYEQHAKFLRSEERTRYSLRFWIDFWGGAEVADVRSIAKQEEFHAWLRDRGQSPGTINRVLTSGRAAINRAWKRAEISQPVHIQMVKLGEEKPKGRPLDVDEINQLLAACPDHIKKFTYWGLATGARPEALIDLRWDQVDIEAGLIRLNPEGRQQTKKHRPTVRLPKNLLRLIGGAGPNGTAVIQYKGQPVKAVRNAWRSARDRAEMDGDVQPYSLRHTVARQ